MKIFNIVLKALLCLLLLLPILGTLGVFPQPTADMYSPTSWAFMQALMNSGYIMPLIALTCAICLLLILIGRMPLAAIILAPFTVNVVSFHVFTDHSFLGAAAIPAWLLLILNAYFLWMSREAYRELW